MALLDCTLPRLYLALIHSTTALLGSNRLYHGSTWLYYTAPRLYLTLVRCTMALLGSHGYEEGQLRTVVLVHMYTYNGEHINR